MCVIIHLPKNKTISWDQLKRSYDKNPDGYGIMAAIDGKMTVMRSMGSFAKFREDWKNIPRNVERAIHFRIKTHGDITLDNCHPFQLTGEHIQGRDGEVLEPYAYPEIWMMHNGIIKTLELDKQKSDTYHFAHFDLGPVTPSYGDAIVDPRFQPEVERISSGSRILFMDASGRVMKTFPKMWTDNKGCDFSNSFSLPWNNKDSYSGNYSSGSKKSKPKANVASTYDEYYESRYGSYRASGSDLLPYGRDRDFMDVDETEDREVSIMQVMEMSDEDLADLLQDKPWEMVDFIRELLGEVPIGERCDALADDCDFGDQGGMPVIPVITPAPVAKVTAAEPPKSISDTQKLAALILKHRIGATSEADTEKTAIGAVKGSAVINKIAATEEPEKKTA